MSRSSRNYDTDPRWTFYLHSDEYREVAMYLATIWAEPEVYPGPPLSQFSWIGHRIAVTARLTNV